MATGTVRSVVGSTAGSVVVAVYVLTGTGCTPARMAVPADVVAASEELVVADRSTWSGALADESFRLGPFAITDVDRDSTSRSSVGVGDLNDSNAQTGYSYRTEGEGVAWSGRCSGGLRERSADLGSGMSVGDEKMTIECECTYGRNVAQFNVRATTTIEYNGGLSLEGVRYDLRGIYEREQGGRSSEPTGFRADTEQGPLGAVEVLRPGRAWISRTVAAEQRPALACLFAGLLLYNPPSSRNR